MILCELPAAAPRRARSLATKVGRYRRIGSPLHSTGKLDGQVTCFRLVIGPMLGKDRKSE